MTRINTNIASLTARRYLQNFNSKERDESMKLSSGNRIVQASFDPAGLAISEHMKSKIRGYGQLKRNVNDSISLLQVAEGTLSILHSLGGRLKELAIQAASDTIGPEERALANKEYQNLKGELKRLTESAKYNGNHLLNGAGSVYDLQVGLRGEEIDRLVYDMNKVLNPQDNFKLSSSHVSTKEGAQNSLGKVDAMIQEIGKSRARLGSTEVRLQSIYRNIEHANENTSAANSLIRDTDVAQSSAEKLKATILKNATTSMLSQANSNPNYVSKLLE